MGAIRAKARTGMWRRTLINVIAFCYSLLEKFEFNEGFARRVFYSKIVKKALTAVIMQP
jgi:hypothetical protein